VLVGVSGGSDSVALLRALLELAPTSEFSVAGVAHFNHQLRARAPGDEQFCRELARTLGLPFVVDGADVAAHAATQGLSIEDAAAGCATTPRARHAASRRRSGRGRPYARRSGGDGGPEADAGAGPVGLGGVYPQRGVVIRPLLDVSRDELRAWLASIGQPWMEGRDECRSEQSA
jgi:tRNA(Ile)-lysidine synthase